VRFEIFERKQGKGTAENVCRGTEENAESDFDVAPFGSHFRALLL
jgi:hypothetical protein